MDFFRDTQEIDSKKIYQVQALYNTDTTLEFLIQPDRDFVFPNEIFLNFAFEIDKNYLVDHQADKLFDSVEVIVNNEKISSRSNSNEYFLSSFFKTKANYGPHHCRTVLKPAGWFGPMNLDADPIKNQASKAVINDRSGSLLKDGSNNLISRKYYVSMQINSSLFQQFKPLPSNVTININFKRAKPQMFLLKITDEVDTTYDSSQIAILNPVLEVTSVSSEKLRKRMQHTEKLEYPIQDGVIRTHVIDDGLTHVRFNATSGGQLPTQIFTALMKPEAFYGSFAYSATNFRAHDARKIELFVDNKALPGSQINISTENTMEAFTKFYRQCKLITNPYGDSSLPPSEFVDSNFMTAYDLSNTGLHSGWLTVDIDFHSTTSEKLMLIVYMVYEKTITFAKDGVVTMS